MRLDYSGSLVSLVETMARVPTLEFARRLDEVLGTPRHEEIDEMVSARMERQSILAQDKPPMLWSIVDEGVLRLPVGGRGRGAASQCLS